MLAHLAVGGLGGVMDLHDGARGNGGARGAPGAHTHSAEVPPGLLGGTLAGTPRAHPQRDPPQRGRVRSVLDTKPPPHGPGGGGFLSGLGAFTNSPIHSERFECTQVRRALPFDHSTQKGGVVVGGAVRRSTGVKTISLGCFALFTVGVGWGVHGAVIIHTASVPKVVGMREVQLRCNATHPSILHQWR